MRPDILIVGQGLAGTMLAWEFERAGISFALADCGDPTAATGVAAGLINPITGRRLVKSWRVDALLPAARSAYRAFEAALGIPLWQEVRVRRWFADDGERRVAGEKEARGELAPYVAPGGRDEAGCWIEGAARVDLPRLLGAARERWRAQGRWRDDAVEVTKSGTQHGLVIDCTGMRGATSGVFDFIPWEFSKGEALEIAVDGLAPDVVFNRRHAIVPLAPGRAWVGATHEPGVTDPTPTPVARAALEASARSLLERGFETVRHRAAVRVNLPDKHPVAGRHPQHASIGVVNGLGAKGALLAPMLARQWTNHLTEGVPFDPEIAAGRFWSRNSSQASAH